MSLTEITVRAAKPPAKGQRTYADASLPGFGLRVSQGGTKTFVLVHGADRERTTIGRYPTISLSQARATAKQVLAERTLGKHRPRTIAFDEAKQLFLSACEKKNRPRTVKDYTRLLKLFPFGSRKLSDIAKQDIAKRLEKLADAPSEQRHALVAVKIFFNWAIGQGYVEQTPCNGMTSGTSAKPRERTLSDKELAVVLSTALKESDSFSFIVALLILTGQRRTEIGSLRWDWIDTKERTITLPSSITKNKRAHTFPYGDTTARLLKQIPVQGDFLFPASRDHVRGKPTSTFNGWPKSKEAFDKKLAGVEPYQLHDIRRTFASGLAALGTPIHVTEKLLNHISGTTGGIVAVYQRHSYMDEMREAVRKWQTHLRLIVREA